MFLNEVFNLLIIFVNMQDTEKLYKYFFDENLILYKKMSLEMFPYLMQFMRYDEN